MGGWMNISVVSYLNSAPLVYGITHSPLTSDFSISKDIPAAGASKLASGEADLALVPVGAFPDPSEVTWIGNYCIGVEGPVRTVCLFSEQPIDKIRRVWLDPHSRTSVQLIRILAEHHWKVNWDFIPAQEGFENSCITGEDAGVCIGDKVFKIENRFPFKYDLAEEWIRFTGLPFVFAAWASKKAPDPEVVRRLDLAQESGIGLIPEIAHEWSPKINLSEEEIRDYLTRNISFDLTDRKRLGMRLFLSLVKRDS